MLIRLVSDVHLEHWTGMRHRVGSVQDAVRDVVDIILPPLDTDSETVLIIAGDLCQATYEQAMVSFFAAIAGRFRHVIYVLGNHEYYDFDYASTLADITDVIKAHGHNVTVIADNVTAIDIDGYRFIAATMWTDYGAKRPDVHAVHDTVMHCIADHRLIYKDATRTRLMSPAALCEVHYGVLDRFETLMGGNTDNSHTVVVTHHMPTFQSVHPMYTLDDTSRKLNHAFTSDLDGRIMEWQPALWVFGHTHVKWSGVIGATRLQCDPYGYPHERREIGRYSGSPVIELP